MGKRIIVFLLITFLPLFLNQPDFDYYSLVLQWPNSFCRLNPNMCKINPVPLDFTIQGLWPNNFTDDQLEFCRDQPAFDYTIVKGPLKENLKEHWPDLASADPYSLSFVEYQWRKHGLCVYPTLNQNAYLWEALTLKKYFAVTRTFLKANIIPDDYEMIEVADISKATAVAIGTKDDYGASLIKCNRGFLTEIVICINSDVNYAMRCPNRTDECGEENVAVLVLVMVFVIPIQIVKIPRRSRRE